MFNKFTRDLSEKRTKQFESLRRRGLSPTAFEPKFTMPTSSSPDDHELANFEIQRKARKEAKRKTQED